MTDITWAQLLVEQLPPGKRLVILYDREALFADSLILAEKGGYMVCHHTTSLTTIRFFEDWRLQHDRKAIVYVGESAPQVPFFVKQAGQELTIAFETFFPNLHRDTLRTLDRDYLPRLWKKKQPSHALTYADSVKYIMSEVFDCSVANMNSLHGFVATAIRVHYNGLRLPQVYADVVAKELTHEGLLTLYPLQPLLASAGYFMDLLQQEWVKYVRGLAKGTSGSHIPFESSDIRVYVDNLFLEGFLEPIDWEVSETLPAWVQYGMKSHGPEKDTAQLEARLAKLEDRPPSAESTFAEWGHHARYYGDLLKYYYAKQRDTNLEARLKNIQKSIGSSFEQWMLEKYASQQSRSISQQPYIVNHIAHFLARQVQERNTRVALVVLDCMSWDSWAVIRDQLGYYLSGLDVSENSVLAQVPTNTSVSRQAIFAASSPKGFAQTINSTHAEPNLWSKFWDQSGVQGVHCGVLKGQDLGELDHVRAATGSQALALVVRMIDDVVHGSQLGSGAVHSSVKLWLSSGWIESLLVLLLDEGYEVFFTSDHGYVEAAGQGSPSQGVLVSRRGQRARVYNSMTFLEQAKQQFPASIAWISHGLPDGYYCLLAEHGKAYLPYGEKAVVHGGISLEETMVPFVRIKRKQNE